MDVSAGNRHLALAPCALPAEPSQALSHPALAAVPKPEVPTAAESMTDVSMADWGVMLNAVKARLRTVVGDDTVSGLLREGLPEEEFRVRCAVLECVAALDQLHATLRHELERRTRMAQELAQAHVTLADARLQLAGTRAEEQQARHMALHDSLTTLPNRAHFRARLDAALTHPAPERRRLALLYIDLDGFKPINDAHGHDVGDELLRIVAARLGRAVRTEDLVARLGGDEFVCLLSNLPRRDQLSHLACKLFDAVSAPLTIGALDLTVRPSIGIATCPEHGETPDLLLKHADAAMYQAKRDRTGYAFFDPAAL